MYSSSHDRKSHGVWEKECIHLMHDIPSCKQKVFSTPNPYKISFNINNMSEVSTIFCS